MFNNQQQPLYGNPYPMQYQQPQAPARQYYTPMVQIPQQQTQAGLIQVTGLEGAKAYPLAPNAEVALFDAGRDVFYVKRTDAGGYPTIAAYQFAPLQEAATSEQPEYVTRQEFEEWKAMVVPKKARATEKKEED